MSQFRLMFAALVFMSVAPANAQTIGFGDAIRIMFQSCGQDIEAYCKKASLANFEIGDCLARNESKISNQCNADRARVATLIQARLEAQAAVANICARDIAQRCKLTVPGAGHVLRCLLKAEKTVSDECNNAIDMAGYR